MTALKMTTFICMLTRNFCDSVSSECLSAGSTLVVTVASPGWARGDLRSHSPCFGGWDNLAVNAGWSDSLLASSGYWWAACPRSNVAGVLANLLFGSLEGRLECYLVCLGGIFWRTAPTSPSQPGRGQSSGGHSGVRSAVQRVSVAPSHAYCCL